MRNLYNEDEEDENDEFDETESETLSDVRFIKSDLIRLLTNVKISMSTFKKKTFLTINIRKD